ncbi:hypothetical protein [Hyalangium versicolor]|nr:hypothetical protein [Hyalangium versicolor]
MYPIHGPDHQNLLERQLVKVRAPDHVEHTFRAMPITHSGKPISAR